MCVCSSSCLFFFTRTEFEREGYYPLPPGERIIVKFVRWLWRKARAANVPVGRQSASAHDVALIIKFVQSCLVGVRACLTLALLLSPLFSSVSVSIYGRVCMCLWVFFFSFSVFAFNQPHPRLKCISIRQYIPEPSKSIMRWLSRRVGAVLCVYKKNFQFPMTRRRRTNM